MMITTQINDFWNWFEQNQEACHKMLSGNRNENLHLELLQQIRRIKSGLGFDIGHHISAMDKIVFVITANNKEDLFPIVVQIIKQAPQIKGWDFIAFRQRHPRKEFIIEFGENKEISYSDLFFERVENSKEFAAKLFIKSDDKYLFDNRVVLTLMLHDIIGEYDNVKNIKWSSWERLTKNNASHLYPIIDLVNQLDEFKFVEKEKGGNSF